MNKNFFLKTGTVGCLLGAAFLINMTGCVGYVDGPRAGVYVEPAPVFIVQDDYVYYPGYQMYYGSRSHQWYYQQGRSWVARPAPRGVSMERLHSAPSVVVDFHDSPAAHNAQVVKAYPKNWKPSGGNSGHQGDQKSGQGKDKRDDNRR